jgi:hypothetical protein
MDSAIHSTTSKQGTIGSIYYGIHLKPCNITLHNLYLAHWINAL